jgi:hypothetical protein
LIGQTVGWVIISTSGNQDEGHDDGTAGHGQPEKRIDPGRSAGGGAGFIGGGAHVG